MRLRAALIVLCAAGWTAATAPGVAAGAVWAGSVEDPVERELYEPDLAEVAVRYDDAGSIVLRVRFHDAVPEEYAAAVDWMVTARPGEFGCGDARQGLSGLLQVRSGDATLTYAEVPEEGVPVEVEIPARRTLSADGRELTVTAESASLTRRPFLCSHVEVAGGDDAPPLLLERVQSSDPPPGAPQPEPPGEGEEGGGAAQPVGGVRVSRARLSFDRRGRRVTGSLRATVCAPVGMRLVVEVRERRRRAGAKRFSPVHVHRFRVLQRRRCQRHVWSWRLRADPAARYRVLATLTVAEERRGQP